MLAKSLFERAAELGTAAAMNNLGVLYFNGIGVSRDIGIARDWFEKAVALKSDDAGQNLKVLEEAAHLNGSQIAARRAACAQSCTAAQKSYVTSICERSPATADNRAERAKCANASLLLAKPCRRFLCGMGLNFAIREPMRRLFPGLCLVRDLRHFG